jgi:DNA repair exonuclease SbcCD ATPase subunit
LLQDKALASGKTEDVRAQMLHYQTTTQSILKKYGFDAYVGTMDGLNGLEMDCKRWRELRVELAELDENLNSYKDKNGLTERPQAETMDADDLRGRLSTLRRQLADCDKRIAEIERVVAQLPDTESAREQAEEKLEHYKDRYQLISDTMSALQSAEKMLKDRYIAPIRERFSYYAEALERVLDEKISMDGDYRVKFERGGEERSDRHLSAGERSLCALCVRLALIDNMYAGEQPFIVMDDPFVHLDELHLKRVAELMATLAQGRQIIYYCCHESRSMIK